MEYLPTLNHWALTGSPAHVNEVLRFAQNDEKLGAIRLRRANPVRSASARFDLAVNPPWAHSLYQAIHQAICALRPISAISSFHGRGADGILFAIDWPPMPGRFSRKSPPIIARPGIFCQTTLKISGALRVPAPESSFITTYTYYPKLPDKDSNLGLSG
jgi:hypothetical protein